RPWQLRGADQLRSCSPPASSVRGMSSRPRGAPARTLADQLRGWSDERLATLLRERPDLATPAPHDSSQLASRAATRSSIHRALAGLDRATLSVLDAQLVAGQTTPDQLVQMVAARPESVTAAIERLIDLGLVWEAPEGLRGLSGVRDALGTRASAGVSGLRPFSPEPADAGTIRARLAELSPAARALLEHV